ncbi:RlmE family RNA methyltransferase [Roseospira marina]|uniref:Ribosomal RNA large subunit methyltransferase E n=1 Tax=Roseospira marina TaxID=140057 RepID=A0A5M6IIR5_9PROT|nr:RlmE family RNA methyltransferase [Roseospira marina]KAA5607585.1 RlmE family RNA methyltransferase [Roseospira marina]MBB4312223.1 23S rRNA (uridine2552-2'-O)-methyltransferase [Roseospira marina]MBB5085761.1 23S rRNA (uridine2552-2'-O)-methyltransferase [Roseospira marina]
MSRRSRSGGSGNSGTGSKGSGEGGKAVGSARKLHTRVRTARGRKPSSTRWLQRQFNDPYVLEARRQGYRSRAAFKLIELDERFHLLKPGLRVVDLGAAPGGWTQIAVDRVHAGKATNAGLVVGVDILEWAEVAGAHCFTLDFMDPAAPEIIQGHCGGPVDLVLSDMAAPTTGHTQTDHLRIMGLAEAAWDFAEHTLAPGGAFVCKVFQGGTEDSLLSRIKMLCANVRHAKPPASRKDSAEMYLVAQGFRGRPDDRDP